MPLRLVSPRVSEPETDLVRSAYAERAAEYADLLGSIDATAEADRRLIAGWAHRCSGPVVDAGCGPGHWTAFLAETGSSIEGIDPVAEFVEIARATHPGLAFRVGSFEDLTPSSWAGILAWYSLIHCDPSRLPSIIGTFRRALLPTGRLLLGFFEGPRLEPFDHAITTAWFWPVEQLATLIEEAGLTVVHVERRHDRGVRPHAAIEAVRSAGS